MPKGCPRVSISKKVIKNTKLRRMYGSDVIKPTTIWRVKVNGKIANMFLERKQALNLAKKIRNQC